MAKGKRQEIINTQEEEIITPEIERQAEIEIEKEKQEDINENVRKLMERAKEEGGSVIVKLKKPNEVKAVNIGKYKANEFDEDLIAKQYGGGTYFYVLRDEHGRIRAKWEEEYAEPLKDNKTGQQDNGNMFVQMSTIIKDLTKEIANIKTEISKPKEDTAKDTLMIEMMKENQKNQVELLKAIATGGQNKNQPSLTEMMALFTGMFGMINKMTPQQQIQQQPQNTMKEVVELASLFAEMKDSPNAQPETFIDTIKTFITDGSLANVITMLKQPKQPMIKAPQQQPQQIGQPKQEISQDEQDKNIVCEFFKQYEKQLFQLKVDGNSAENVAGTILSVITMNNDFKVIAYRFFKDIDNAFDSLYKNSVEFKNEQEFLKNIVINIHKYFYSDEEQPQETTQEKQELPQGEVINNEE